MLAATRHTRVISAAEGLARATFTEILPSVGELVSLRKEFGTLMRVAKCRHEALKSGLSHWREQVTRGEVDFEDSWEDEFKGALRALIALQSLLLEKYDAYRSRGIILAKPLPVGLVRSQRADAENTLDAWKSPEWETTDERVVKWDKEQTEYLYRRLAASD